MVQHYCHGVTISFMGHSFMGSKLMPWIFQVQVNFRSNKEVVVKDSPILKCQVIEPNIVEGGEVIAAIPIKISVRSVFSK